MFYRSRHYLIEKVNSRGCRFDVASTWSNQKKINEYDQEIPQLHTADQPTAP